MPDPEVDDRVTQAKKAGTTRRLDENESDTRQMIYRAMVHSIYLNGYNGAPLREVASSVGIRMPSLYHHFEDKAEIFRQLNLKLTYHPGRMLVKAEVRPTQFGFFDGVRGPIRTLRT